MCSKRWAKPVRPATTLAGPTWYQMLTATTGRRVSFRRMTSRPLASRCAVALADDPGAHRLLTQRLPGRLALEEGVVGHHGHEGGEEDEPAQGAGAGAGVVVGRLRSGEAGDDDPDDEDGAGDGEVD